MQDLRFAVRTLRKQPVFVLVAVLTLALGIGANAAIFSLLYQVLLRPLPYREPQQLVFIWNAYLKAGSEMSRVAIPDYLDRRSDASALQDAALFTDRDLSLSVSGRPEQVKALAVTPSFFSTLGRGPMLGRAFVDADATTGADRFTILTHQTWTSHFGADPAIVGRTVHLNGAEYVVLGVLPADFQIPWPAWKDTALLVPFSFTPAQRSDDERGNEFSMMIGRLRDGSSVEQLNAQMQSIVTRLMDRVPARASYMRNSGFTGVAASLHEELVHDVRLSLYLVQGGVLVVLLIACVNVANLLLMRATGRRREFAIRIALGAGRWRIMRQLLCEGAVLSTLGGALGLALGVGAQRALTALTMDQMPPAAATNIQPTVLLFTCLLTLMTTVVFGVLPAMTSGRSTGSSLKDDSARGTSSPLTVHLRAMLVVAEIALAVVLLVSAGLLVKSFARVIRVDPGFEPEHVVTAQIALPAERYAASDAKRAFWGRLLDATRPVPEAASIGFVSTLPFSGRSSSGSYTIVGRPFDPTEKLPHAGQDIVGGDYFRAMGIPLREGRFFSDADTATSPRVAIVDQFFADRQFPHESPVGYQINFGSPRNYTVVGVVGTVKSDDLSRPVPEERIYLNATQLPQATMDVVIKTNVDAAGVVSQLRTIVRAIDPEQPIAAVRTLDEWIDRSLTTRRTPMTLLALFGALALVLSAIGVYGVLAFSVAQRVREFGLRQALGATRGSILSLVLTQGMTTTAVGVAVGFGLSLMLSRYVQSMLFSVGPHDPMVFLAVSALLAVVAATACYVPARRATRVDPMVALREG
jgi:predicted permease